MDNSATGRKCFFVGELIIMKNGTHSKMQISIVKTINEKEGVTFQKTWMPFPLCTRRDNMPERTFRHIQLDPMVDCVLLESVAGGRSKPECAQGPTSTMSRRACGTRWRKVAGYSTLEVGRVCTAHQHHHGRRIAPSAQARVEQVQTFSDRR